MAVVLNEVIIANLAQKQLIIDVLQVELNQANIYVTYYDQSSAVYTMNLARQNSLQSQLAAAQTDYNNYKTVVGG